MKKGLLGIFVLLCCGLSATVQAKEEEAASISIIGGADGPTSIFLAGKLGDDDSEKTQDVAAQNLYELKTKYIGNNVSVVSIEIGRAHV